MRNALKCLDTLFRNGEETFQIIGALTGISANYGVSGRCWTARRAKPDIGREVGINPIFSGEMTQQAKNFNRSELRRLFDELYHCDVASKTAAVIPIHLMHALVVTICCG